MNTRWDAFESSFHAWPSGHQFFKGLPPGGGARACRYGKHVRPAGPRGIVKFIRILIDRAKFFEEQNFSLGLIDLLIKKNLN